MGEVTMNSAIASVAGITLFFPGIAAVVIAADFPVARCIPLKKFDALQPLRDIPEDRSFDRAIDVEAPALAGNVRRQAEVEGGPVPGQMLSRRQALLFGPRGFSGEEAALARPALLAARQFCGRRFVAAVGHISSHHYS